MNTSLLILRVVLGLGFASHGAQKLFGWFGGGGISGTGSFFETIGFRPGTRFALAAGLGEFLGGTLLALGFLGPVGPALMISVMVVAILTVHRGRGFFVYNNGAELPIVYSTAAVAVAFAGPGQYSIDRVLGFDSSFPELAIGLILACGVLAGLLTLAFRHSPELITKAS
jgi:putative oxidoreductase